MSGTEQLQQVDLKYPVGRFKRPEVISAQNRTAAIAELAKMPAALNQALAGLNREQLDTPYREGGWTVRQLVHHIADSHMNAFVRIRLALTQEMPTIVPYDEKSWAMLPDSAGPVSWSTELIEGLHARWVMMMTTLSEEQWKRGFRHPERGDLTIESTTLLYAWHARHHVAHITRLREREGW